MFPAQRVALRTLGRLFGRYGRISVGYTEVMGDRTGAGRQICCVQGNPKVEIAGIPYSRYKFPYRLLTFKNLAGGGPAKFLVFIWYP